MRPRSPRRVVGMVGLAMILLASDACAPRLGRVPPSTPFALDGRALAQREPKLAAKIGRSPLAFFRYQNRAFVDEVCARYGRSIPTMPLVHLHGDAHLEQYVVAAEGRGLADFDASAVGPPVVDLARFATSIVLAWPDDEAAQRAAVAALLRGYVRALDDPSAADVAPEPAVATRIRARFPPSTEAWLDRVQSLIAPMSPEETATFEALWPSLFDQLRAKDASISSSFFAIKAGGGLDMGIGSAHAQKFLVRVEGPTPAPADDLVMEAKAVESGALGSCMRGVDLDPLRVIRGQERLSSTPQLFLAAAVVDGKPFYSHTWLVDYTELSASDIESAADLVALAEDVGLQLGRGHAKVLDGLGPEDGKDVPGGGLAELRAGLRRVAAAHGGPAASGQGLTRLARELAAEVTRAWETYRAGLPPSSNPRAPSRRARQVAPPSSVSAERGRGTTSANAPSSNATTTR